MAWSAWISHPEHALSQPEHYSRDPVLAPLAAYVAPSPFPFFIAWLQFLSRVFFNIDLL